MIDASWLADEARALGVDALAALPAAAAPTLDPRFLPDARTLLVAAQCYRAEPPDAAPGTGPLGSIAPYTWSNFYKDLRRRLTKLGRRVAARVPGARVRLSVNGALPEKPLAVAAGMGGFGLTTLVLTPDFGSLMVLGVLVTDAPLDVEAGPLVGRGGGACTRCGRCVAACPTGALGVDADGRPRLARSRCIQALCTAPGALPAEVRAVWGTRLYGCSTCQDACPVNQPVRPRRPLPAAGLVGPSLPLLEVLAMDEASWRSRVAGNQMAASWVPFAAIRRNARLALGRPEDGED